MAAVSSHTARGKRIALISVGVSAALAISKIIIGIVAGSTSVVADGFESAGDVVASGFVFFGMAIAARPPDEDHPYGHGRYETLTGLVVGLVLLFGGVGICIRSLQNIGAVHAPPAWYALVPLAISFVAKATLSTAKFRVGREIRSSAIIADAWNDFVDIASATAAMTAVGLTLSDPAHFLPADHYGGFAVGLIVVFTGIRVAKETSGHLSDRMPQPAMLAEVRNVALGIPGVNGVEKCFARNTGLQYHVDLHLEVDPEMTVWQSHEIATRVRLAIREQLDWVADVLVHVEPSPKIPACQTRNRG